MNTAGGRWGIELGAQSARLAILQGDGVRLDATPMAVVFTRTAPGDVVRAQVGSVGLIARASGRQAYVATEFRAFLGKPDWFFEVEDLGIRESARQLTTRVLQKLKNSLRAHGDLPPLSAAVITVPAVFDNPAVEDTLRAGAEAGIQHVELLKEPVAAALAYGRQMDTTHNPIWLVYDLGGGTFDVALIRARTVCSMSSTTPATATWEARIWTRRSSGS